MRLALWILLACMPLASASAAEIRVAVAANFRAPLLALAPVFQAETGHELKISTGSTGVLFAQIQRGAPFDVFLAADQDRPAALAKAGLISGHPITYAAGRLIVIYRDGFVAPENAPLDGVRTLSIANPRTAPYGAAAMDVLDHLSPAQRPRLAQAQSVAGVNAAVVTGAADAGFAALSSVMGPDTPEPVGWQVPADLHDPILQDAVVLARAKTPKAAQVFLDWLTAAPAQNLIKTYGYDVR